METCFDKASANWKKAGTLACTVTRQATEELVSRDRDICIPAPAPSPGLAQPGAE
jgi:hypothetical protein